MRSSTADDEEPVNKTGAGCHLCADDMHRDETIFVVHTRVDVGVINMFNRFRIASASALFFFAGAILHAGSNASLLGRWTDGYISSIQYKNVYTGVGTPTNGRTFAYEFKPDGTYSFTGLIQSVMYNCTTAMFSNETGTYTIEGDSVSFHPEKNPFRMTNNCAPSSNREAPGKLNERAYRFRISNENGRRYLQFVGTDGGVQKFGESR
jgi:hypothetical protein